MASLRTKALILRHTADREQDRTLVVLTPDHGQMRLRARGTKKSVSKLSGSLEPLTEVDLMLASGRVLDVVTGSVILDRFPGLRQDILKTVAGQWLLELLERMTKPDHAGAELYELSRRGLHELEKAQPPAGRIWLALCRTAWNLLVHEGFVPPLDRCAGCSKKIEQASAIFLPGRGCFHASEADGEGLPLSVETMTWFQTGQVPDNVRDVFRQAHQLLERSIHDTLDQPLRSEAVLQRVMRLEQLSTNGTSGTL